MDLKMSLFWSIAVKLLASHEMLLLLSDFALAPSTDVNWACDLPIPTPTWVPNHKSIKSSKRQIGRARVVHLQNHCFMTIWSVLNKTTLESDRQGKRERDGKVGGLGVPALFWVQGQMSKAWYYLELLKQLLVHISNFFFGLARFF